MLALVLLVQEKTGEQTLWSFPRRCQRENGRRLVGMLGPGTCLRFRGMQAERECHWAINSPNRKVVNSLAPTRRDSVLVSHPGAQRGLPALPLSQSGTSNKPLLSLGFCVFTYEYVMVEDILHLHYSSS